MLYVVFYLVCFSICLGCVWFVVMGLYGYFWGGGNVVLWIVVV